MGNMRLPEYEEDGRKHIDYAKAKEIIDCLYAAGVNYYDTAYIYHGGESEAFVGRALAGYPRDSYYIATKFNYQADPDFRRQFTQQLANLDRAYVDFYLLHGIQDNFADDILGCGCIPYFEEMKKEGKIRFLGFSFHGSEANLLKTLACADWDFVQIQLNYYDWEYGNQRRLYEILEERGIPVVVMEPVHGGMLANLNDEAAAYLREQDPDASFASWAMRWIKSLPGVQVVLSGMSTVEQAEDNIRTFSEAADLGEEEKAVTKHVAELLRKELAVPCTGCRYCVPNCPMGLEIPKLLAAYNTAVPGGQLWQLRSLRLMPEDKWPTACIGCGACTAHCPQALDVPAYMQKMAEALRE